MNTPKCFLDDKEAVDSFNVEVGNDYEILVPLNVCQDHLNESEQLGDEFDKKYGAQIEKLAIEHAINISDYYESRR